MVLTPEGKKLNESGQSRYREAEDQKTGGTDTAERTDQRMNRAGTTKETGEKKKTEITIRQMTPEDVPAAAALERACFSEPWSENAYLGTLADEKALYLVAETEDGEIAGICGLLDILGEGDISNVAVAEPFRRRKVAERMMAELLKQGKERGITAFTLEVRSSNEAAIRLYEKFGFVCEGRRKNFYRKPDEDALILWYRTGEIDDRCLFVGNGGDDAPAIQMAYVPDGKI